MPPPPPPPQQQQQQEHSSLLPPSRRTWARLPPCCSHRLPRRRRTLVLPPRLHPVQLLQIPSMTRPRSLCSNLLGSNAEGEDRRLSGSDGVMTRAMWRRRLFAGSSVHSREKISVQPEEWRDWANLMPDLIDDISGRLLSLDVAEYLRFRAVCKPWRDGTDDPRAGVIDRRFRPRNWIVPCITPDPTPQRRLLNLATGASIGVEIPAFSNHCYLGAADGLLLLYHRFTRAIRLLDPLSNVITEFPALLRSKIVVAVPPKFKSDIYAVYREKWILVANLIDGAGLDDSTSPPSLVLCLRGAVHNIIFAKPGDEQWTLVSPGQASHWLFDSQGRIAFQTLASFGGCCYFSSPEGSVYVLQLQPLPQLVEIVNQRNNSKSMDNIMRNRYIHSFLVGARTGGRLLLLRYHRNIDYLGGRAAYSHRELFTVKSTTGFMEMIEVDIASKRLVPLRSLGRQTVFVGETHCVAVSVETFPSIIPNAVYMGYCQQMDGTFGACHLNSMRIEPAHEFVRDERMRLLPRARPCNIDQYLVCYVDRRCMFSDNCIIHSQHGRLSECVV